ncbi:MAG: lanthionine synthetase LanC family protein [Planctomycetota bacterium]|jgi:rhamnogalacturonyl hydrolase YesR
MGNHVRIGKDRRGIRRGAFTALAVALLLLLGISAATAGEGEWPEGKTVIIGSDGDWPAFLEAVPASVRYDDFNRPRLHPLLSLPHLYPYTLEIETHIRNGKLVYRAEGPPAEGIPAVKEGREEFGQKIVLPSLLERLSLVKAEGLDHVRASLKCLADGTEIPVEKDAMKTPSRGGEWSLRLKVKEDAPKTGTVRLRFEVRGWDLTVVENFLKAYRPDKVIVVGTLPTAVLYALSKTHAVSVGNPFLLWRRERPLRAIVSTSYRSGLVGAHVAGLDNAAHVVHTGSIESTEKKIAGIPVKEVILLSDPKGKDAEALKGALEKKATLKGVRFRVVSHEDAEADLCRRHYLGDVVVANPADIDFPPHAAYPRASIAAPVYGIWRRAGVVFVSGGDLDRFEKTKMFKNIYFGVNGYQRAFQWEDVAKTRREIIAGVKRFDLSSHPFLTLLGGDANIPCTFFIAGAWPKSEFPKIRFGADAVIDADASIYANLNNDPAMEACVGRIMGNTDEITATLARGMFRREMEDLGKFKMNKALLVFGPWARKKDRAGDETFEAETIRALKKAGEYDCTSFVGSTWGKDFLEHIGQARIFFANDFGYHNAAWGWSSYAHRDYSGPEANYNTQNFPLTFDASYCVASSNGCATCDDKNRDNLHYGGNSLPVGLLFFRNGAMGFFGMPNAALAEITTPLEAISKGVSLGEAIRKHMNDRIKDPKQGGLFGPPSGWRAEVPDYDNLPKTHPVLFPMTKQDALVLFGDPQARLTRPPAGSYLDLAQGAADFLIAGAKKHEAGWDLVREKKPEESAWGQAGAGAGIFLARLYEATGEEKYLEAAKKAAAWIAHITEKDTDRVPGLFVGDAGKGLFYLELARVTKEKKYFEMADRIARHFGEGWTYKENKQPYWMTDLYMGAAGHLLFLLEMHKVKPDPFYMKEAVRAGEFILKWAEPAGEDAWSWSWQPWESGRKFYYTGLAHGVAGIVVCLADLYTATKEKKFLTYAEGGAKLVMEKAIPLERGYKWYAKYTPEPAKIKYQWCHGPPGMLFMFLKMHEVTGKAIYKTWAEKTAYTTAKPGKYYRMGMSLCHGAPGNGDMLLEAYRVLGDEKFLDAAKDHAEWVRAHAVKAEGGLDWMYANRSYMNGVAGIGHVYLRLADPKRYRMALITK